MAIIDSVKLPDNSTYEVADNHSGYQKETLTTPLTINGTQETTVEGALGGLNDYGDALADNLATNENVYGSKNLNSYPYYNANNATIGGVTYTVNSDGSIKAINSPTSNSAFYMHSRTEEYMSLHLDAGTYIFSGCPTGGSEATYCMYLSLKDANDVSVTVIDTGNGVTIVIPSGASNATVSISISNGTTIPASGLLFKPMIRDARIKDDTFVPFAKTNKQLTDDKAERNDLSTIHVTGSTNSTGSTITAGTHFYLNGLYCKALANIAVNATFTLNTNYSVTSVNDELHILTLYSYGSSTLANALASIAASIGNGREKTIIVTSSDMPTVYGTIAVRSGNGTFLGVAPQTGALIKGYSFNGSAWTIAAV